MKFWRKSRGRFSGVGWLKLEKVVNILAEVKVNSLDRYLIVISVLLH